MSVVITLIILSVLILVHEWGHFIVARKTGIPVYEFSLGFGYRLLHYEKKGVTYSFRIFPIGGFVRMAGEQPDDQEHPDGFNNRTPLEKIRVAFAGPLMNFVLPVFIFIYCYAFIGVAAPVKDVIIGGVIADQPAAQAGLKENDHILAVNNQTVNTWDGFTALVQKSNQKPLELKIKRGESVIYKTVTPEISKGSTTPKLGVYSQVMYEKQGILKSIKLGFIRTYDFTVLMFQSLGMLFSGAASPSDLAGPVGITVMVGEAAQGGMLNLLAFAAFLSINLGVLNLLPIPALDGSLILYALVESIRKKPIAPEKQGFINWIGFMFLMLLIIVVTFNDIVRLIKG